MYRYPTHIWASSITNTVLKLVEFFYMYFFMRNSLHSNSTAKHIFFKDFSDVIMDSLISQKPCVCNWIIIAIREQF